MKKLASFFVGATLLASLRMAFDLSPITASSQEEQCGRYLAKIKSGEYRWRVNVTDTGKVLPYHFGGKIYVENVKGQNKARMVVMNGEKVYQPPEAEQKDVCVASLPRWKPPSRKPKK